MKTLLDIGIDIEGLLYIFIPKDTVAPFEIEHQIKFHNHLNEMMDMSLCIFEGACIENRHNHLINNYELKNARNGFFCLKMKLFEKNEILIVSLLLDDIELDHFECADESIANDFLSRITQEDQDKRKWLNAKIEFEEFVRSSYSILNEKDLEKNEDPEFKNAIHHLKMCLCVMDNVDDVTTEEYEHMLEEIECYVRPVMSKIKMF
jgi:hypothetical protein